MYMRFLTFLLILMSGMGVTVAQNLPDTVYERQALEKLMALMNLQLTDLIFRDDYTKKDSFRLATVANLMRQPYGMIHFVEQFKDTCRSQKPEPIFSFALEHIGKETQQFRWEAADLSQGDSLDRGMNLFYRSLEFNRLLRKADKYLYKIFPPSADSAFAWLAPEEKSFLMKQFKQLLLEDTLDQIRSPQQIDSIQDAEEEFIKQFVRFGTKIRKDIIVSAGVAAAIELHREINLLLEEIRAGHLSARGILSDTAVLPPRTGIAQYLGRKEGWAIGGPEDNYYKGDSHFIIDFGGNDRYDLVYNPDNPHGTIIIDLAGNDIYNGLTDFTVGSGGMNVGLLFDMSGDDIYSGKDFSLGSGFFGFGLLYDAAGNDRYYGDTHVQGAATFGIGSILDLGGNDVYSAALYGQGFGGPEGAGFIVDYLGNDNYMAGNKYKDVLRYDDHYLSLSQGFAYGFRPYISGGIGAIIDYKGNDNYVSDIFAQGTSYWWALGMIYDSSGNDQYVSYQYAQGAATHMTMGILLDQSGNDFYRGKGLMQGCGHDYSCAIMLDRYGDDIYHAVDLSQGAGSANGFGIMLDARGNDAYYVMKTNNTQGFGDARRDFGSIGLFLDLSGTDRYDGNGGENRFWRTPSKWGGGLDEEFILPDSAVSGL